MAEFGKTHLKKDGSIYAEIHEDQGNAVSELFSQAGYQPQFKKDMQQKDRMMRAVVSQ
jgi:methylase of polypeptide subunit release factors